MDGLTGNDSKGGNTGMSVQQLMEYAFRTYRALGSPGAHGCTDCKKDCVECHKSRYWGGKIRYDCDNVRRVHVIRNLPVQIALTNCVLDDAMPHLKLKDEPLIRAASLGGGPGAELFALWWCLRVANKHGKRSIEELRFHNVDIERGWREVYLDLVNAYRDTSGDIRVKATFQVLDATHNLRGKPQLDIAFVSWIISEQGNKFCDRMLGNAHAIVRPGGLAVLMDRTEPAIREAVSNAISSSGQWDVLDHDETSSVHCGVSYPEDIKEQFKVKLTSETYYWILRRLP